MDFVRAFRSLWRDRRFSGPVVMILALGLAASTATFTVVDTYLFRPLPYPDAERVVQIRQTPRSLDWRSQQNVFEEVAAWDLDGFVLLNGEYPEEVPGAWVSPGFFSVLGVTPALGRVFGPDEYEQNGATVAVISHRLWRSRFGGDLAVIGSPFRVFSADRPTEAQVFTVVGVLPEDFWYPSDFVDVLVPLRGDTDRVVSLAKLRAGVTPEDASAALSQAYTERSGATGEEARVDVLRMQDFHTEQIRPRLELLMTAVLLMLVLATLNASVLLLVRATVREREISVRLALGAGWFRLVRQLLAEGLSVAAAAAVIGTFAAWIGTGSLAALAEQRLATGLPGGVGSLGLDVRVLSTALALTFACGILLSAVPLFPLLRSPLARALRGAGGRADAPAMRRFRSALIAAEVAISLALLLTAGLLGRSALHQQQLDLGFEPGNLLTSTVLLRQQTYPDLEARAAFLERVVEELEASPEVVSATVVTPVPLAAGRAPSLVQSEGSSDTGGLEATVFRMLPDAFSDLGIPLLRGRAFETTDRPETEAVAVVSETFANTLWPGMNPTGQRIRMAPAGVGAEPGPWIRVVGVAGDVRAQLRAEDTPDLYLPIHQAAFATNGVVIRTRAPAVSGADVLRSVLRKLDPDLAAARVRPFDQLTADALAQGRFLATFIAGFAAVAMAVSMFGLYAVIAYAVQQRRREVAIRLTLGATPPEVARLFIAKAWLTVLAGLAAGALLALPIIRLLRDQLQGLETSDPATWALVISAVMCCALLAVWMPARGAGRTQPAEVLRGD